MSEVAVHIALTVLQSCNNSISTALFIVKLSQQQFWLLFFWRGPYFFSYGEAFTVAVYRRESNLAISSSAVTKIKYSYYWAYCYHVKKKINF
jgi:hypothetical protein